MANRQRQPNILLITTDQQRYDTYGSDRSDWPQVINLARLRRESTTLTNAYSNSPVCMPCRYTWLTGLYASQCERGPRNGYDWPDYQATMPQALRRAGYHTAMIGKLHAHSGGMLEEYHLNELEPHAHVWGFETICECSGRSLWSIGCSRKQPAVNDRYTDYLKARGLYEKALQENRDRERSRGAHAGLEPYRPGVLEKDDTLDGFIIDRMCDFIKGCDGQEPFFLHASFWGPHHPLDVPREYFDRYRPEDMPPPRGIDDSGLVRRWQENRAMYMGLMSLVDEQIGHLLAAVDRRGLMEDTVILFTTDHGDMLGDDGFANKCQPHEGSCRTPILVHYPREVRGNVVLPGLVEAVDLPQTILAIAGLDEAARGEALPGSPGRSFWSYVRQGGDLFRESVFAEIGDSSTRRTMRMIRHGDWKYARSSDLGDRLYNLGIDPNELVNLADDPASAVKLREMQGRLIDRLALIRQPPIQGRFRGEELMRKLRDSGTESIDT